MIERVKVTPEATALIEKLVAQHGPLMFHQSGGCCDGSAPMCYPRGEFRVGERDVYLGEIAGVPVYISGPQFEYWQHTQLIIDAVPGRGSGFSLESPEGLRFLTRSRVYTEEEFEELDRMGPPARGPQAAANASAAG
jgi:uncharacterized protein (DUF779 family)